MLTLKLIFVRENSNNKAVEQKKVHLHVDMTNISPPSEKNVPLRMFVVLHIMCIVRAVARSENPGGHIVLGGDNVPPLVEIGLTDLSKSGGAHAPRPPRLRQA